MHNITWIISQSLINWKTVPQLIRKLSIKRMLFELTEGLTKSFEESSFHKFMLVTLAWVCPVTARLTSSLITLVHSGDIRIKISQVNSGEKNKTGSKLENQTKLENLVDVLSLLSIKSPSTLNELSNEKKISSKNMKTHLGFLLNQGLISKTGQGKKLPAVFSLTQLGTYVLICFKPFQEKIQSEFMSEEKKWAISKLVVRK